MSKKKSKKNGNLRKEKLIRRKLRKEAKLKKDFLNNSITKNDLVEHKKFLDTHISGYELADETDLSSIVLKKMTQIGFIPIRVPVRMNGISSKGDRMMCHHNVKKIVRRYGGKRLVGHEIQSWRDASDNALIIDGFCHSVWITPESKVVCICKSNYGEHDNFHHSVLEKGYIIFVARQIDNIPYLNDDQGMHFDFQIKGQNISQRYPWYCEDRYTGLTVAVSQAKSLLRQKIKNSNFAMMMTSMNNYLGDWETLCARKVA